MLLQPTPVVSQSVPDMVEDAVSEVEEQIIPELPELEGDDSDDEEDDGGEAAEEADDDPVEQVVEQVEEIVEQMPVVPDVLDEIAPAQEEENNPPPPSSDERQQRSSSPVLPSVPTPSVPATDFFDGREEGTGGIPVAATPEEPTEDLTELPDNTDTVAEEESETSVIWRQSYVIPGWVLVLAMVLAGAVSAFTYYMGVKHQTRFMRKLRQNKA